MASRPISGTKPASHPGDDERPSAVCSGRMTAFVTYLDPQPILAELPHHLASPFEPGAPHPLAQRAAAHLQDRLRQGLPFPIDTFRGLHRGKMFGVLVVADRESRIGYLKGFSGMVGKDWTVEGFVGPLFDLAAREAVWPAGEAELIAFDNKLAALELGDETQSLRVARSSLQTDHDRARMALRIIHDAKREKREALRREQDAVSPRTLSEESRSDSKAERRLRSIQRNERAVLDQKIQALIVQRKDLVQQRASRSCELLEHFFGGYQLANARNEIRSLREIFAPKTPPGGAGDCAAPKLFGFAQNHGFMPLALAEFWWGTPPSTGGRQSGNFYPACRGKCGPVLGHMLQGWNVDPAPIFGDSPIPSHEPRTIFEDEWIVVVDKPIGLLSVPGRSGQLQDSVRTRLRARYPESDGQIVVHRLDLDTSGLMLAAKDPLTHAALQKLFFLRGIDKKYIALLDGLVPGEEGTIDLPIRVDLDDRPRQIHDPVDGKPATTKWRVLERDVARTRVALFPLTGRTHQLRVHAAHPQGLNAPIVGDRIYGRAADRMMLHAETIGFVHPHTRRRIEFKSPAPF